MSIKAGKLKGLGVSAVRRSGTLTLIRMFV